MNFNKRFFEDVELQCMGYESPIKKIYTDIQNKLIEDEEKMTLQAVQNVGIDVDKEELLKALKYDRNQYEKGYKDGKKDIIREIHKIYTTHNLSDEEVLELIKLVLNREMK